MGQLPGQGHSEQWGHGVTQCCLPLAPTLLTAIPPRGKGKPFKVCGPNDILFSLRSDWVTSYKVMVSNDSHTWATVKNGSGDMVSLFPLTSVPGSVGLCKGRQCVPGQCLHLEFTDSVVTQTSHRVWWIMATASMP